MPQIIEDAVNKILATINPNGDVNKNILYISSLMRLSLILEGEELSNLQKKIISIATECFNNNQSDENCLHIWVLSILSFSFIHGVTDLLSSAEKYCKEFIVYNPESLHILQILGRIYQTYATRLLKGFNKNIDLAIDYYNQGLNYEPQNSSLLVNLGTAYLDKFYKIKKSDYLELAYDAFIKAEKDSKEIKTYDFSDSYVEPDASFNIAKIHALKEEIPEALFYLEKSLKNNLSLSRREIVETHALSNLENSENYWKLINKFRPIKVPKPIFFTEDSDAQAFKLVLEASGFDLNKIEVQEYQGCGRLDVIKHLSEYVRKKDNNKIIFIHRDRDYLSDKFISEQIVECEKMGVNFFVTKGTDIESYFISPEHINSLYPEIPIDIAELLINEAIDEKSIESMEKFKGSNKKDIDIEDFSTKSKEEIDKIISEKFEKNKFRYSHGKKVLNHLKSKIHKEYKFKPNLFQKSDFIVEPYLKEKSREIKMKLEGL